MVGATRFELVTFCTPSKRATRLRYAPTEKAKNGMDYSKTDLRTQEGR